MFILYDLIFLLAALFYIPLYLVKGKFHRGFLARLGFLPKHPDLGRPIWIHAVSVGEVKAIKGLVEGLRKTYPEKKFVISSVTATGNKIARSLAGPQDLVTYLPLDLSGILNRVLKAIKPCLFIIVETEIWPNLIRSLKSNQIPVVTVNARVSDNSFGGYRMIKLLLAPVLRKVDLFCAQSDRDAKRLIELGVLAQNIEVTGNMKFDLKDYTDLKKDYPDYRLKLSLGVNDRLLVAGSTHPGEEEIILEVYRDLLKEFPDLKLLIAPRHPERADQISGSVSGFGFRSVFISESAKQCSSCLARPVFILDTIGELVNYYAIAELVFIGGSLIKKGGQNLLEPALFEKPILFGPYMFNFRDIAELFLSNQAACLVHNHQELHQGIVRLLNDPRAARAIGNRAKQLITDNKGATSKNMELIKRYIA